MMDEIINIVKSSGTSFYYAMRFLPKEKRQAMYVLYAFCRIVDDIADEPNLEEVKNKLLNDWRTNINDIYNGKINDDICLEISNIVKKFNLPKREFMEIIDGMNMDINMGMRAPSLEDLMIYARRVAGAVGILSVKIFGDDTKKAEGFAIALGNALQITNILRDMGEDIDMGRLYMPKEIVGEDIIDINGILTDPNIGEKREKLSRIAMINFKEAELFLKTADKDILKPAISMMQVYYGLFKMMEDRGWEKINPRVKLSKLKMIGIALWPKSTL